MTPSTPSLREHLLVVLHQTQSPDNLGAVARVMTNFGFPRAMLSDPQTFAFQAAEKLAVKGQQVLTALRIERTLKDAVAECVYAVGTTSRDNLHGRVPLTPEEAVKRLAENAARGQVALVLGGERRGLSDDELDCCQDVLVIPTEPAQPSMNLAQAAAVLLYLCAREDDGVRVERDASASSEAQGRPADVPGSPTARTAASASASAAARLETLEALRHRMREGLTAADFLSYQDPEAILSEMVRTLGRSGLSQREAEIWLNAFKHVERAIRGHVPRKKP